VIAPFSGVGVNGADVMFDNLLGTTEAEPDRIRRCDIMFPEGDITTFGSEFVGDVGLLEVAKRGELESVGVGGVLTIRGAGPFRDGGVCGRAFVSMGLTFAARGLSGDDAVDLGLTWGNCLSENIELTLAVMTLPRLESAPPSLVFSD
jgi:hypothetical protein